jgi:thioredoxin reductase/ferredoxin
MGYMRWLHTQWPAGRVEKWPLVREDGSTNVPSLYIVGDLTGIPLLKFSADTGARAVQNILLDPTFKKRDRETNLAGKKALDLVVIGSGVSGMAAALEARNHNLNFEVLEASEPFSTVVNFPKRKPIYTYPTDMKPAGQLRFSEKANIKEGLVEELYAQTIKLGIQPRIARAERVVRRAGLLEVVVPGGENLVAHRVVVGIGRSGNFRKLGVPGEHLDKVYNRLHDPRDYANANVLVVGGGDSALETAIATAQCGAKVIVSYRKPEFSRPKPENIEKIQALQADPMADVQVEEPTSERVTTASGGFMKHSRKPGSIKLMLSSKVKQVTPDQVVITNAKGIDETSPNDVVFSMIGREAPLDFFRRSGVHIRGEWRWPTYVSFVLVLLACAFIYHWKKTGIGGFEHIPVLRDVVGIGETFAKNKWFPFNIPDTWASLGGAFARPSHLLGTLKASIGEPGFYYSLAYCACVTLFGFKRIKRRKTPYVKAQTLTLMAIQIVPLFLLPYLLLPWAGNNGWFDSGVLGSIADHLFPRANYGHGREYWRSFGLILAWPLFFWNVFTEQPMWAWLIISFIQTFILIPAIIYRWGKGAYCGWICSCGALAETLGDTQRHKMPHGPAWNRVNMVGQVFLAAAFALLVTRSLAWVWPGSVFDRFFHGLFKELPIFNYVWFVDLLWAGIIGVGFYWHFSGRVWCRFACPLAALMHLYARFSRFRILADKKKCISCNVCTSVCHQGIDIMNFANKGLPMADPECVRCSACVQSCPTGVLTFGQIDLATGRVLKTDRTAASPVQMAEILVKGRKI